MPPSKVQPKRYSFKPFDWSWIRYDATIGIFGQRGTGKTNFSRNVMRHNRLERSFVICESPEIRSKYKDIPRVYRHAEYDEEFLRNFLRGQDKISKKVVGKFTTYQNQMKKEVAARQADEWQKLTSDLHSKGMKYSWSPKQVEDAFKKGRKKLESQHQKEAVDLKKHYRQVWDDLRKPYAVDVYIDDCSSDNKIMNSKLMRILMNNGRHFICRVVIMVQYCIDFPAKLRGALDWVVVFKETIEKNLKRLYENYASVFSSFGEFKRVLESVAKGYRCMVINMRSTEPLEKRVFFCDPEDLDDIELPIGSDKYRLYNDLYAKESKEEDNNEEAPTKEGGESSDDEDDDGGGADEDKTEDEKRQDWTKGMAQRILANIDQKEKQKGVQDRRRERREKREGQVAAKKEIVVDTL